MLFVRWTSTATLLPASGSCCTNQHVQWPPCHGTELGKCYLELMCSSACRIEHGLCVLVSGHVLLAVYLCLKLPMLTHSRSAKCSSLALLHGSLYCAVRDFPVSFGCWLVNASDAGVRTPYHGIDPAL
jgi:hypothetical protein